MTIASSISAGESPRTRQADALISLDQADDFACKASKEEVVEEDNVVTTGVHGTTPTDNTDSQPVIQEKGGQELRGSLAMPHRIGVTRKKKKRIGVGGLLFEMTPPSLSENHQLDLKIY